jgi:hypothetical protein
MGYKISSVRSEPIFVVTFDEEYGLMTDLPASIAEVKQMLDNSAEPISIIYDMRRMSIHIGDIVNGFRLATHDELNIANHPMLIKQVMLSSDEIQGIIARALKQSQRGGQSVDVVSSMEIALNRIRPIHRKMQVSV